MIVCKDHRIEGNETECPYCTIDELSKAVSKCLRAMEYGCGFAGNQDWIDAIGELKDLVSLPEGG